jgi:hypothetical protein
LVREDQENKIQLYDGVGANCDYRRFNGGNLFFKEEKMIQQKQIDFCKEFDDCLALVVNILKAMKAKKPVAEIAASELPDLMNALSGLDQIGDELKNKKVMLETIGLRIADIVDALVE